MSVFTFGETMVALRGDGQLKLGGTMAVSVAGAESNVAIGLARLGHPVHWAGATGADEAGELVLRTLRAEGVGVTATTRDEAAPTGLLLFEPRLPGVTRVHYYRAGSAGSRIAADDVERAFTAFLDAGTGADTGADTGANTNRATRVLHLTGITPALSPTARSAAERAMELAAENDVLISLDVNFRSRLWSTEEASAVLRDWAPRADVLIASDDELPLCLPADCPEDPARQAEALLEAGAGEVVVKLGAAGATAYTLQGELHAPARTVPVVDPVGAGDAFVAGYLSALLDGSDTGERLDRAVTTGAFAVAASGDWEGAPTRAELGLLGAAPGTVVR
ncbi:MULTISPECIES: sugar kinase [unclassified Streptomyces]|uniref:sugar kinase n=1 Tax=unclassified Streptomyces TaxID=2593676 RepID=UPI002E0D78CF|nr:sugar kinase [Streptomyces sp. NBC_01197]WSS48874.1 sugar kinase [Streptomyces sp. NBC_01180]